MTSYDEALVSGSTDVDTDQQTWRREFVARLLLADTLGLVLAVGVAGSIRLGRYGWLHGQNIGGVNYVITGVLVAAGWLLLLQVFGAYDPRFLGVGAEEFKRVTRSALWVAGLLAVFCYSLKIDVARGFVAGVIPIGFLMLVLGRLAVRRWLHVRRAHGLASYSVLAVGSRVSVQHLVDELDRSAFAGLRVVGACVDSRDGEAEIGGRVPVLGTLDEAVDVAAAHGIDIVAASPSATLPSRFLRELGWGLEGTGTRLLVTPSLTDVAGPRITVTPVAGVPLVWVDEPEFTGARRVAKRGVDMVGALLLLLLSSPVLLATSLAIRLDSPGPVFYRQLRTGIDGTEFRVWKFRSMYVDAERRRADLDAANQSDGHLFKIKDDPRVTRIGALIRRLSIDELPQLLNVVTGEMSLVGPRPLPVTDSGYEGFARRRLLVRPGITGLWQVSGRSDLSWDEAVRLDLYYVENWSFALDLVILMRTVTAVMRGAGAY